MIAKTKPAVPATAAAPAKRVRKPKLQAVASDHEEVALAKLTHRASPVSPILQAVSDHIAKKAAAGETSILALTREQETIVSLEGKNAELQDRLSFKIGECLGLEASLCAWEAMLADEKALHEKDVADLTEQNVQLMGDLREAQAAHGRDVKTLRGELDALDIAKAQSEAIAKQALSDLANANKKVRDLERSRDDRSDSQLAERRSMESRLRDSQGETRRMTDRITELGSDLDAAEIRIGHLEQALAHAQGGWIAQLFRRRAGGRA